MKFFFVNLKNFYSQTSKLRVIHIPQSIFVSVACVIRAQRYSSQNCDCMWDNLYSVVNHIEIRNKIYITHQSSWLQSLQSCCEAVCLKVNTRTRDGSKTLLIEPSRGFAAAYFYSEFGTSTPRSCMEVWL